MNHKEPINLNTTPADQLPACLPGSDGHVFFIVRRPRHNRSGEFTHRCAICQLETVADDSD